MAVQAVALGVRFQMYTQFASETAMYVPDPRRCRGGIRRGLDNFEIRIDYVQHHISAVLGYCRILEEMEKDRKEPRPAEPVTRSPG